MAQPHDEIFVDGLEAVLDRYLSTEPTTDDLLRCMGDDDRVDPGDHHRGGPAVPAAGAGRAHAVLPDALQRDVADTQRTGVYPCPGGRPHR
jgi:hypothetical protein